MSKYVDGFVIVVPKNKTEEYKKMAQMGRDTWMKFGALEYYECQGNDLAALDMGGDKSRTFPDMTGASDQDSVWFSFIVFKSKEHRDEVNALVNEEMGKTMADFDVPFQMNKVTYGGFQVEVEG